MPWTKLKNVILVILAAANLFLFILVAGPAIQSRRIAGEARAETLRFLQSRGVLVAEEAVPQAMELPPQRLKKLVFPHPTVGEIIREAMFKI